MMKNETTLKNPRRLLAGTLLALCLIAYLCATTTGCVRRRMTVLTNPSGATAYLDNKPIGKTPLTTGFQHYGKRKFTFVKDGYETKTVILPVRAPWYEWVGIDFISEVLLPGKLVDHQHFEVDMVPRQIMSQSDLLEQAEEMRRTTHSGQSLRVVDPMPLAPAQEPWSGSIAPPDSTLPNVPSPTYSTPVLAPTAPTVYPPNTPVPSSVNQPAPLSTPAPAPLTGVPTASSYPQPFTPLPGQ